MPNETYESAQSTTTVDLREYAQLLWHWAWLILLAGVIAGCTAYYLKRQEVPRYTATTLLLVSEPPTSKTSDTSQSAIVPSNLMAQTYTMMLKSLPVLQQVVDRLQIQLNPLSLKSMISAALVANTQLIQVTITDTNPQRAAAIANTLGGVFSEQIQSLQSVRFAQSKTSLTQQIAEMEAQLQQVSDQLTRVTDPLEKSQLDTRQTQYRLIYSNLVSSFEQLRISEAQSITIVVQVEPATVPWRPINANSLQNAILVALVGMLLAGGVVIAFDLLDDTVRNPDEISMQTGLPILGIIPHHQNKEATPITQSAPRSPISEAYRALRTNVEYANADHNLHRILITSPLPDDGKTTVAANLAIVMAQDGRRTILVDGDLRQPRAHRALGLKNHSGLSNLFLQAEVLLDGHIQMTPHKDLRFIGSGPLPPNPAELLGSGRMTTILNLLGEQSDMILVDTPPSLTVTDATVLAPLVDGILIVVKAGGTKTKAALRLVAALRQVGARMIGIVVNDVRITRSYYKDYYHNAYYESDQPHSSNGKVRQNKKNTPIAKN